MWPTCDHGTCVTFVGTGAGDCEVSVSEYAFDASKLADKIALTASMARYSSPRRREPKSFR
jgi:hypothetical protein